ncbi:HAD hydrolase-like protein [Streptomyces sp. NPDC022067]|uniref:HAD family hydrolase n=1 Tax=Streptomyces sp. NPDC022067 TaxID=3154906 RepID=UPI0033E44827
MSPSRPGSHGLADGRPELVRTALGCPQVSAEVAVGDAPSDVRGGLGAGVRVVGVATGRTSAEDPRAAGAAEIGRSSGRSVPRCR